MIKYGRFLFYRYADEKDCLTSTSKYDTNHFLVIKFHESKLLLHCPSRSCPAISQEIRNIPLDIIRNENIIYLDNNLRSDGIVWNWRRL